MPFGTLNVYVEGAVNIKDSSIIGRGSPYCTVTCGQQAFNTQVVAEGGSCPFFNASLQFKIDRTTTELHITILSKNTLRDDDILGYTTLMFKEIFFHSHSVPLTDYPVIRPTGRTQGQIRLSLTFHSQPKPHGYVDRPGPHPRVNNFRPGVPSQIPRHSSAAHPGASNPLGRPTSQPGQPNHGYTPAYAQPQPQQYAPVQQPRYHHQQQAPAYPPAPITPRHQGPIGGPPPPHRRPATAAPAVTKSPKSSSSSSSESSDDEKDTPGSKDHRGPNKRNPQPTAAPRHGSGQTKGLGFAPNPNPPNQRLPRQKQHQQHNGAPAPPPGHQRGPLPPQQQQRQLYGAPAPPPSLAQEVQQFLQPILQGSNPPPPKHRRGGAANANGNAAQNGGNDPNGGDDDGGAGNGDTSTADGADGGDGKDTIGGANDGGPANGDTSATDGADGGDGNDTNGGANDGGAGNADTSATDGGDGNDTNGGANDGGAGNGDTSAADGGDGGDASYNVVYEYDYEYEYEYDYAEVVQGDGTVDPSQAYDTSEAVGYDPGYYQQEYYQGDQDDGYQQEDYQQQDDSYQQDDYQQQDDSYQQDDYQQQDDSYQDNGDDFF